MVGKNKNRRTADGFLKLFLLCLRFLIKLNKTTLLKVMDRKCLINRMWIHGGQYVRGVLLFLLARDMVGNTPIASSVLFGHFAQCIRYSVCNADKVSNTLQAFPKESPIPFRYCSNGLQELLDAFPNVSHHQFRHFLSISSKLRVPVY